MPLGEAGVSIILNENKDTHGPINPKLQMCDKRSENIYVKMLIYTYSWRLAMKSNSLPTFSHIVSTFHTSMCFSRYNDQILSRRSV